MSTLRDAINSEIQSAEATLAATQARINDLKAKLATVDTQFQSVLDAEIERVKSWFAGVEAHLGIKNA